MSTGDNANYQNGNTKNRNEIRSEVLELNIKRNELENELKEYQEVLQTQNIGMDDPLVDNQGFPRTDLDLYTVRHARNRIICLTNDLKNIMKQIEDKMSDYFVA